MKTIGDLKYNLQTQKQKGFITVVDRSVLNAKTTHIYSGSFAEPDEPMCKHCPDSFFRNNTTNKWCKTCIKNTLNIINNK